PAGAAVLHVRRRVDARAAAAGALVASAEIARQPLRRRVARHGGHAGGVQTDRAARARGAAETAARGVVREVSGGASAAVADVVGAEVALGVVVRGVALLQAVAVARTAEAGRAAAHARVVADAHRAGDARRARQPADAAVAVVAAKRRQVLALPPAALTEAGVAEQARVGRQRMAAICRHAVRAGLRVAHRPRDA